MTEYKVFFKKVINEYYEIVADDENEAIEIAKDLAVDPAWQDDGEIIEVHVEDE